MFQNNQVLGPYEPDDLSRHPAFGAESLVCPEGRRGTSMGDWQRAGMVPDLSLTLVKNAQAQSALTPVAALAGLPPEPTLKDIALLNSLQEKMAMMEDVVLQLQEGMRAKDAELAALHEEIAGKDIDKDIDVDVRKREAAALKADAADFKIKITELEERVSTINRLRETIDKAVEAEKHVEHDIEAQGATLAELTREMEALRSTLQERAAIVAVPEPTTVPEPPASAPLEVAPAPPPEMVPEPEPAPPVLFDPISPAPLPIVSEPEAATDLVTPPLPGDGGRKKKIILSGLAGILALAALGIISRRPVNRKPALPPDLTDNEPLQTPVAASTAAPEMPPVPAPEPPPDPRQTAIAAAKRWSIANGRTLGETLETLSPPSGNLSPWMADLAAEADAHGKDADKEHLAQIVRDRKTMGLIEGKAVYNDT